MKNKELKKSVPVELDDDALDTVSGGTTNGDPFRVPLPSDPLINHDDVSVEPIEEVTPSIP